MGRGLQVVEKRERALFGVGEDDPPLRGRHVDDVLPRRAGLRRLQGLRHVAGQLAEGIVLGRRVELQRLHAAREAEMPAIDQPPLRVHAAARIRIDAVAHVAVDPRRHLELEGAIVITCGAGNDGVVIRLAERDGPRDGIHLLRGLVVERFRCARLVEAGMRVDARQVLRAAQPDHVAPVGGIDRQPRRHGNRAGAAIGPFEDHSRHAAALDGHSRRLPAPQHTNLSAALRSVGGEQVLEEPGRCGGRDRLRGRPAVAGRRHSIFLAVVFANPLDYFEEEPRAWKIRRLSADERAFIDRADAFCAELPPQPVDVVHEGDAFHAESGRLHGGGARRLVSSHDQEIDAERLILGLERRRRREEQRGEEGNQEPSVRPEQPRVTHVVGMLRDRCPVDRIPTSSHAEITLPRARHRLHARRHASPQAMRGIGEGRCLKDSPANGTSVTVVRSVSCMWAQAGR